MNKERKDFIAGIFPTLVNKINSGKVEINDNLIYIKTSEINEGLAGLIANRISDAIDKPVIIAVLPGRNGIIKGSGRFTGEFDFFSQIQTFFDKFERLGGHANAFGFTIESDKLDKVILRLNENLNQIDVPKKRFYIDIEIELDQIDNDFINRLSIFEPHGKKNDEVLFLTREINITKFFRFGKTNNHGKFTFPDSSINAIGWNIADIMESVYAEKKSIDIIYNLELNHFRGKDHPRMMIVDFD